MSRGGTRTMAIHLAGDHATCCASRQLDELPMQSSDKQWTSVECILLTLIS